MTFNVTIVQQTNAIEHDHLLAEMYRQRKRIFADKLGWRVTVINGQEIDKYDIPCPVYLICQDEAGKVTGSLRLLPTTGPTLLADQFADTLPDAMFSSPSIWECTRFCSETNETAAALIAALGELCLKYGIHTIVGNFDAAMLRIYSRIGIEVHVLGSDAEGTVFLGSFPLTEKILRRVKSRMAAMARVEA